MPTSYIRIQGLKANLVLKPGAYLYAPLASYNNAGLVKPNTEFTIGAGGSLSLVKDSAPTSGSTKPVQSGGTYTAIADAILVSAGYTDVEIDKIIDGVLTAKKAEQDASGHNIESTYETKSDATAKEAAEDARLDALETFKNTTAYADFVQKVQKVAGLYLSGDISKEDLTAALNEATTSVKGLMSSADKAKLDALPTNSSLETSLTTLQDNIDAEEARALGAEETLQDNIDVHTAEIDSLKDATRSLGSIPEHTGSVTQLILTTKALTVKSAPENGDVIYDADSHEWEWNGSSWVDNGEWKATATATASERGVVKGGSDISIAADGTMSVPELANCVRRTATLTTTLATAYSTLGRVIGVNGTNGSYVLVLWLNGSTYDGRIMGSGRIGSRNFRQLSGIATIQDAINDSIQSTGSDYYELITGTAFASLIGVSSIYNQGLYEIKDSSSTTYKYGSKYSLSATGVATLLALPDAIVSGLDAKAGKFYATNLVTNGDFTSNITPWSYKNGATIDWYNGTLRLINTATNGYSSIAITTVAGHIYYFKAYVSGGVVGSTRFKVGNTTKYTTTTAGETLSGIDVSTSTSTSVIFGNQSADTTTYQYIDKIVIIDLTALYGAGSEPTQVEMDKYLAQKFANSYFDGTVEYATLADITGNKASVIKATNGVTGGNMTSTTPFGVYAGTLAVANNILTLTGNGVNAQPGMNQNTSLKLINGHKYYARVVAKSTTALATRLDLVAYGSNPVTTIGTIAQVSNPVNGTAYVLAGIVTATTQTEYFRVVFNPTYASATDANGSTSDWSYLIAIDLTATFGAGKEPTVSQMNTYLAYYTNSWFDGTIPFITLPMLLNIKANKTQEDWLTPTLLNGATNTNETAYNSVGYMKDETGVVRFKGIVTVGGLGYSYRFMALPSVYKPTKNLYLATCSNGTFAIIYIDTDGMVWLSAGQLTQVSLDGLSFRPV